MAKPKRQKLVFFSASPYSYLGVCGEGRPPFMGLNEAGLGSANSLVKTPGGLATNSALQRYVWANFGDLNQVSHYIRQRVDSDQCNASGCFGFIDRNGNAGLFEVNRSRRCVVYDSMDSDRQQEGLLGAVVRANEFHREEDGTDDERAGGRYDSATRDLSGLYGLGMLSVRATVQGNDGQAGFEVARYGPGRQLDTIARIDGRHTVAAMVVQGVKPGEDPALATMWVMLGNPDFSIAVPAWVAVTEVPDCLGSGRMYDLAMSLQEVGEEAAVQARLLAVEAHFFETVEEVLLPHWRAWRTWSLFTWGARR